MASFKRLDLKYDYELNRQIIKVAERLHNDGSVDGMEVYISRSPSITLPTAPWYKDPFKPWVHEAKGPRLQAIVLTRQSKGPIFVVFWDRLGAFNRKGVHEFSDDLGYQAPSNGFATTTIYVDTADGRLMSGLDKERPSMWLIFGGFLRGFAKVQYGVGAGKTAKANARLVLDSDPAFWRKTVDPAQVAAQIRKWNSSLLKQTVCKGSSVCQ